MWNAWTGLTDSVRTGTAAERPALEGTNAEWTESFIAAMHRNAETTAQEVVHAVGADGVHRMLDVGGGSGAYSIAFANANPNLQSELLDLASVVPIARKHIDAAGLNGRVVTRIGDLTKDELGQRFDLVLLSAICHMLSPEENRDLLGRAWDALAPGGRLVVRDFILEPDKTSPKPAALFALHMLVNTWGGATYSEEEYRNWLREAGFTRVMRHETARDLIIATK
jgi:predicted O-methyltransferase YrrM